MRTARLRGARICFLISTTLVFVGCGGGSSTAPIPCSASNTCVAPEFLYAINQNASLQPVILGFTVDPTLGTLSGPTSTSISFADFNLLGIPKHNFAYVSNVATNQLEGFAINPTTGVPTPLSGSPFSVVDPNASLGPVSTDLQGKFLFVVEFGVGAQIITYSIDSTTGALTPTSNLSSPPGVTTAFTPDGSGKFLYASSSNGVAAFALDSSTGALTQVAGSPFPLQSSDGSPVNFIVDSTNHFLYGVVPGMVGQNGFFFNDVVGFSIDSATGALSQIPDTQFLPIDDILGAAIVTSGSFVYVNGEQGVTAFSIAPGTGKLAPLGGSPFPPGTIDGGMTVSRDGKFLYEAVNPWGIAVFGVNPSTGAITPVGSPVSTVNESFSLIFY